jgi:predicted ester cyclase
MEEIQAAKQHVLEFFERLDAGDRGDETAEACRWAMASSHIYRGVYPFDELDGPQAVADLIWSPFRGAFGRFQRRLDILLAGRNNMEDDAPVWVVATGHLLGLFDTSWLGIPATGRLGYLPFASFFRVDDGRIVETVEFLDILSVIHQAGCNPFAGAQTASEIMAPGPRTLDGVMHEPCDAEDGRSTLALSNAMLDDLVEEMRSPDEHLQRFWHGDMNWFGPTGIGSCLGHDGYRRGHTQPFETRLDLVEAIYPGPCNIAEGCFSAHFWRPGLRMRPAGGFLGLPPRGEPADIRVADIYRRDGDKLAENWVFIDMLHFLRMQGVDLFADISANASAF